MPSTSGTGSSGDVLGRLFCMCVCVYLQSCWRRVKAAKVVLEMRRHRAASRLQANRRMVVARRRFTAMQSENAPALFFPCVMSPRNGFGSCSRGFWLCRVFVILIGVGTGRGDCSSRCEAPWSSAERWRLSRTLISSAEHALSQLTSLPKTLYSLAAK